jgi:hypothetical protein
MEVAFGLNQKSICHLWRCCDNDPIGKFSSPRGGVISRLAGDISTRLE